MSDLVSLPRLKIQADGIMLGDEALLTLDKIRVQQRLSSPTLCELTFRQPREAIIRLLQPGTGLRVELFDESESLFVGEVTAVEYLYGPSGAQEVHIRGYDLLHRLRKRQSVRSHVQVTVRDLAKEFANDLGLQVEAEEAGPLWPYLFQPHQSDFALLIEMAERCGLYLTLRENTLHLITLNEKPTPLPLKWGEELLEARIELNAHAVNNSVRTSSWNTLRVESYQEEATQPRKGYRVAAEVQAADVGGWGEVNLLNVAALDDDHAQALAQAELDRRQATEVSLWGVAVGDPRLQPGKSVEVTGVDKSVAGNYLLTEVTHLVNGCLGYISELNSLPPPPQKRPTGTTATLGVVTQVGDPQKLGRVRVSLPTFGDVETDWMNVLSPGGGADKGLIMVPEAGDDVLVLLSRQDPGQGVVLGGLYGMNGPPDSGVEDGTVQRYTFLTRGGQRIQLDDAANSLRLENDKGSYIELKPNKVHIRARTNLDIEAPGHAIVIRGKTIDFQQG